MTRKSWKRGLMFLGTALLFLVGSALSLGCCVFSGSAYRGPPSDHFDGTRFENQQPVAHGGLGAFIKWQMESEQGPWEVVSDAKPGPPPPRRVPRGQLRVTFVNHATLLIQQDEVNILTDPIWSERCSPVSFAGPKRFRPSGIRFEDLPPIDAVVVSHNHYDHMDVPTLQRLSDQFPKMRVYVGLGNREFLEKKGVRNVHELDWWQSSRLGAVELVGVPAQHFANRGTCDGGKTLWLGYVVKGPAGNTYFAGDTGYGPHFEQIGQRFGPLRLALLPIGAYKPIWFMKAAHVSPAEAVIAHEAVRASTSVAMHYGTFDLGDDGQWEPVTELNKALDERPVRPRFWVLDFGEGREVPLVIESAPE